VITIEHLQLAQGPTTIVNDLSLVVRPGEVVVLVGESGVGKTSFLRAVYGDLRPIRGRIVVDGVVVAPPGSRRIPELRRRMGLIFQDDKLLDDRTVYDNLLFTLAIQCRDRSAPARRSLEILSELGLSHLRSKYPSELSAGEAQRIGIARALASAPSIILADEPTGDLDTSTSSEIFRYLGSQVGQTGVMILATHDTELAAQFIPRARCLRLSDGLLSTQNQ